MRVSPRRLPVVRPERRRGREHPRLGRPVAREFPPLTGRVVLGVVRPESTGGGESIEVAERLPEVRTGPATVSAVGTLPCPQPAVATRDDGVTPHDAPSVTSTVPVVRQHGVGDVALAEQYDMNVWKALLGELGDDHGRRARSVGEAVGKPRLQAVHIVH